MKTKQIIVTIFLATLGALLFASCRQGEDRPEQPVRLGAVLPMTGDAAKYGKWIQQGSRMAVDDINAKGGIKGRQLMLDIQDCQTSPSAGASAFLHLVTTKPPVAVLTTLTGVSRALIPLAESNNIVLFVNATLPGMTEGHQYVFRNVTSLASDIPAMVDYAVKNLRVPKVGILWRNDEFGVWGSREFEKLYGQQSGKVVLSLSYDPKTEDFRTHITRMAEASPDAVYLLGYSEMGKLARQTRELGHKWQFLGISTLGDPDAIRMAAGALEGAVFTEPAFSASSDPKVLQFNENYRKRFGEDAEVWGATFYDAIHIIAAALGDQPPTSENLRQGLLGIKEFPGVTGSTTFLANGDVIKRVELRQIRDGKAGPVTP